ncbi:MAG: MtrB/PioB family outer membrane beta-barrel protein [Candidatus Solibacter usitatus]|nr:MtrB/PioB family outer membrane beta-barrel protein [Candidatus Solibacter usitatus]
MKLLYARQWFDRKHRDVGQTIEDSYKFAVDLKPGKDFTFRISGARQNREPQETEYEWFLLPGTQRPDEGFRRRNRVDLLTQYDLTGRLSVSGFFATTQDNFNRRSDLTSLVPLGDPSLVKITTARPTPAYGPYYVYGVLRDFGWNWGGDFDYLLSQNVTLFGEYARERASHHMVSRQRSRNTASQLGCPSVVGANDCDPINDWFTLTRGIVDTYTVGADLSLHKRLNVSMYYSLAASKDNSFTDGVNCQIGAGPNDYCRTNFTNWMLDSAVNRVVTFSFPETVNRLHEVDVFAKFQLSKSLYPKFEYRFERVDYKDFQTSVMNPTAYVGPVIDPAGTTGLQRMLFLGADTPGFKVHVFKATLEYRF